MYIHMYVLPLLGIWVHSGCVYWSPGVCLLGDRITGLEDAVNTASKTVCELITLI